ncbi:MAG: hypothetical protein WBJ75_06875, partial [Pseudohongiellaceae bacterium]
MAQNRDNPGKSLAGQAPTGGSGPRPRSDQSETAQVETGIEAPRRAGMIIAFLVFGVFGLWAVLAPIEGAAHAPGSVTVRSYKK